MSALTESMPEPAHLFELACPAGWVRLDPRRIDDHRIASLAAQFARRAEKSLREVVAHRIATDLGGQLRSLAEAGTLVVLMAGPTSPLSVWQPMVAISPLAWPADVEPMPAMVATAAHDPSAQVYDLDEAVALRTWTCAELTDTDIDLALKASGVGGVAADATTGESDGQPLDRRRFDGMRCARYTFRYQIGIPDDRDAWVEAVCVATLVGPAESALEHEALIELFDAVLSTFRWVIR